MEPQGKDIDKMDITELKALAYDQLAMIENCQNNMKAINLKIAEKMKKPVEEGEE